MGLLTTQAVSLWRNQYVAKAGSDPIARKSAERSGASYIRAGRSLFTRDILAVLRVKLPSNPFAGVKVKAPGAQRYHSEINPEWLLACAGEELRGNHPQQYLAMFFCLWAGLRAKKRRATKKVQMRWPANLLAPPPDCRSPFRAANDILRA